MTRIGVVLGWPVAHSKSPALHQAAFRALGVDAAFVALAVPPPSLAHAIAGLAAAPFLGASVTVPLKEAAAALCTSLVEPAARIGAVNCLVFPGGGAVIGHNTDAGGFVDALAEAGVLAGGRRAVLLGAGGAARAIAAGLLDAGAAEVRVLARRPAVVAWTGALPWTTPLDGVDLLVDCTPTALDPLQELQLVDSLALAALAPDAVVASLVYHRRPLLLDRASARGLATLDGKGMLLHQGARALALARPTGTDRRDANGTVAAACASATTHRRAQMASTTRVRSASAFVALCLGFTGSTIAWADGSHEQVRDRWVENPYQAHDTTGAEVRLGSLVAIVAVDGTEYTGLGGVVAAGHRWGRISLDAEYGYLEITEKGPSGLHYGSTHALGINFRFDVIRLGSRVVGPNSMAAVYVEGSVARQFRIADPASQIERKPHSFPSGQSNQLATGFGLMFDHRLEQPRGFPNRIGWQLGWRVIGTPRPEPGSFTTCRGSDCTATSRSTGMMEVGLGETSLELSSSLAFTW